MPSPGPQVAKFEAAAPSLPWDTACDLLGGADWSTIPEPIQSSWLLRTRFSSGRQFLFQDDPDRLPLEFLWLKLSGFACLCRAVAEFYQQRHRPHLSLSPRCISAQVGDPTFAWLPARWLFTVKLNEAEGARSLTHETMPKDMAREIFVPPAEIDALYASPAIEQWPMGREFPVTVLLRAVERIRDEVDGQASRGHIRAHVFSDTVSFADFTEYDVFHITLKLAKSETTLIPLWARKVEEAERGVVVSGVTGAIPHAVWAQLERAKQQVFSETRTEIYRALHHSCDLHSLGMLLLRCLLVTPSRPLESLQHELSEVLERLGPLVQGLNPDDHWTLFKRVSGRLKEQREVFTPLSDRNSEFVWYDAVICGLRLVSRIPGFSFCDQSGETHEKYVPEALASTTRAAEQLAEQARIDLFEAAARHRELLRICDLVSTECM